MFEETYKKIENYNYCVSNLGNIKNIKTNKILKQRYDKDGYPRVNLSKNGVFKTFSIHRLIAEVFIKNPGKKPQVDHIDRDKTNNNVKNLRWCECYQNQRNKLKQSTNTTSIYKGVSKHYSKWQVYIVLQNKHIYLGLYDNEHTAAEKYNEYIIKNNLEYFVLNEIKK